MRKGAFYFLELPVYRLSEDEYYEKRSAEIGSAVKDYASPITPSNPLIAKRLSRREDNIREHLLSEYGVWRYNGIIGYVRLHLLGCQIRGEYWRVTTKRKVSNRKKFGTLGTESRTSNSIAYKRLKQRNLPYHS